MSSSSKAIAACALILLICIGALSFWSEIRNGKDREWVTRTLLVVEKLQAVRIDISQAEAGQRGYILTGQERYLELLGGVDQVHRDMKELQDLTSVNVWERGSIRQLDPLIAARLAELGEAIKVRKRGGLQAGAEAVARANNGEKWMGQIALQIGEMRRMEAVLLNRRMEAATTSGRRMKAIVVVGNALAILILVVQGFVLHRKTRQRDVAEKKLEHTQERLERRTSELSDSKVELESFAYSVAHDLRAPLRHIAGYSNVLVQDYAPRLDAEARRYLGKIVDSAQKMGHLVDDLLRLSKIRLQKLSLQNTSLDSLVRPAVEELNRAHSARKIDWQIGDLFEVRCDPGLMKQVFVNLLSNAVKYTAKRDHAVIQVGQMEKDHELVIFVRDNGVGFDMKYARHLFGIFQRLHRPGDFQGTGVGLAIVQRIVRKHGGRIWAEAEPDHGATFFLTLGSPEIKKADELKPVMEHGVVHA
jgi:signal transduction histidine kinase